MDMKSTFFNGILKEEVHIDQQPLGYMRIGEEKKVLRSKKTLYELKQALQAWNNCIDTYFKKNIYQQCSYEHSLYIKETCR